MICLRSHNWGMVEMDSNLGVGCNTHPSNTHPSYTYCISILHIIPGVYPAFSFLHHCRHWDGFASHLNPKHSLVPWSSTAPPISVFLSLVAPLRFFLLWTIHIPFSQKHTPSFLIKAACRLTQQHAPIYGGGNDTEVTK